MIKTTLATLLFVVAFPMGVIYFAFFVVFFWVMFFPCAAYDFVTKQDPLGGAMGWLSDVHPVLPMGVAEHIRDRWL